MSEPRITAPVFDTLLAILDDAMTLAKEACEVAESQPIPVAQAHQPAPQVHLTKVASHVYEKTASALVRTGVFGDVSVDEMRLTLEEAGESGHLAILEKLASRAAFPLNVRVTSDGELVERQTTSATPQPGMSPRTATWRTALDEARAEQG